MENKKIKILAIDDIPDNLISIKAQIKVSFPEALIFTALNGTKGIELAASEDPDVILLDIVMPDMDGYEVCKLLKSNQEQRNIPVVFITANKSDQESRIRALECGAEALLAKPIDPIELTAQIRAMVKIKDANIIKQKEKEQLSQLVDEQVRELKANHTATLNLLEDLRNEVEIRKQSEAALRISELRFKQVSEDALEWIWEVDTEGLYTYTSPVVETLLGYKTTEIVGKKHFYDFFTPDMKEELKAAALATFSEKKSFRNFENPTIHKDGHIVILESNGSPIIDNEGNLIGYRGVDSDITERKNSEIRIREKDIQFRKLSSSLPDMIFQFTRKADGTYCVPVASEGIWNIYGLFPDDVIDDFTPIFKLIYPEDSARLVSEIQNSAEHFTNFDIEYRVQIPGQDIKWLHCKSIPERLADGSITWYGFIMDITRRKLAEENLKRSEYNLSEAERIGNSGSWDYDVATGIASWSANMFRIFDVDPDMPTELVFNHFVENLVIPDDRPHILSIFQDALAGKRPYDLEYNIIKKDGSIRTIHAIAETLRDENGNAIRLMGKVEDITQRKQAEEALHRKESIHNKMLSNIGDVIVIIDKEGINRYKSENIEKWFGWKPEDVLGSSTWNLVHPDDLESAQQFVGKLMNESDSVGTTECRYLCKDGSYKWIEITMTNLMNDPDILGILGNYHDITERKQAGQELITAKDNAQQSETRLKLATFAGSLGIWDWNVKDNVMIWDDRMFELYGIAKDTFPNNNDAWTNGLHPDDKQRAIDECYASLNSGNNFDTSFRVVHPNGKIIHLKANALVFRESDGKPLRMIGINKDISESIYAEEQLLLAIDHAEQSDRLKSAFLANMSHEIRTPMNGILGFAELLKEPGLNGKQQQHYISVIEKSGARMLNIINDIVDISKIEAGLMTIHMQKSNINEQIEYIATFFRPEVEKKGIQFSFKTGLPERDAIIKTDREKVFAILTNLVKNAIKYTDKGSIEIGYNLVETYEDNPVETHGRASSVGELAEPLLEFYVRDTGIGIPKDRQKAIFERFIQVDAIDKMARQGAGLGLAIAKSFVEMLGGHMRIESEVKIGSTFYFTIPYTTEPVVKEPDQIHIFMDEVLQQFKKLIILIAEDDKDSELFLELAVKKISKKIIKAKTGFEAVEACRMNSDIDLVLMDVQMPLMDGYEATRQIRRINKDVVIIAQTAFGLSKDKEKAMLAGCNDYISKPIQREKLLNMLQKHFEN